MKKLFVIIAILLVLIAVAAVFFASRPKDVPGAAVGPLDRGDPATVSPAGKWPRSVTGPTAPPIPAAAGGHTPAGESVPEKWRDPRALDPLPLAVNLGGPPFERRKDGKILKRDVAESASDLNDTSHEPVEDLQILGSLVGAYRSIFKQNPIAGENREVVEALTGKNEYNLAFMNPDHPAINSEGELVDRWGVPYRFHPISGEHMEILSAGEDGQFGTGDDVMVDEPVEIGDSGTEE